MKTWVRFDQGGKQGFGTLEGDTITVHTGNMFDKPTPTGETLKRAQVKLLTPCVPTKMILLWNNFRALAERLGVPIPTEPLYLLKPGSAFIADGDVVKKPKSYDGRVVYEGELGIVIGKRCKDASEAEAADCIFGYTVTNDVTAGDIINKEQSNFPNFPQWTRAKGYDTFGSFGPGIVTGIKDPSKLVIKTFLDGAERQNYPVSDMVFPVNKLISMISHDMTLEPGDVISCGTSVGVGSMKQGSTVEVVIDGIGKLTNKFE
ncbi:MAG: FAA hydrolase family protein [Oxalobacter sp.]|jgi:2-keto-4-pentenoate hydratase/2-oxohepta-3-ene-1,7-dioic acid hydratase in catechol pathway|nr:MAG: FAA hydrolase family protein [Oxalobacter sp.]